MTEIWQDCFIACYGMLHFFLQGVSLPNFLSLGAMTMNPYNLHFFGGLDTLSHISFLNSTVQILILPKNHTLRIIDL